MSSTTSELTAGPTPRRGSGLDWGLILRQITGILRLVDVFEAVSRMIEGDNATSTD